MEYCAIAHVFYLENVDFIVLRAISDGADEDATADFTNNLHKSAHNSAKICCYLLDEISRANSTSL